MYNEDGDFTMKKSVLICNPNSGKNNKEVLAKKFKDILNDYGYEVEIIFTKYAGHAKKIMTELPDLVDTLIEDYMGIFGKIENFTNIIDIPECPIEYLETLLALCDNSKDLLQGRSELESDLDAIKSLIDSTLYQLKELTKLQEPKHLTGYLKTKMF